MNDLDKLNETLAQVGKTLNGIIYLVLLMMLMMLVSTVGNFLAVYIILTSLG